MVNDYLIERELRYIDELIESIFDLLEGKE